MSKQSRKISAKISSIWASTSASESHREWRILGPSILRLPLPFWEANMFFRGARDTKVRHISGGFPKTLRSHKASHPIFTLQTKNEDDLGFRVCPCTSSPFQGRYIPKGTVLEVTGRVMDKDSYLLEHYHFQVPRDPDFIRDLVYWGTVPDGSIQELSR